MALETLLILDGNRNPVPSLQVALSSVEGRCVYLITPPPPLILTEIKTKSSDIPLPRIKFPEPPKDEFIFPLPSPMTELTHKSTTDIPELKTINHRKSIGKSISSSLINRGLSPRDTSQPDMPISAGHTPRFLDEGPPAPTDGSEKVVQPPLSKDEKRKSWKNQLSKRTSEIHTKSLNSNVRSQIPPIHTNPSSKTLPTQNSRPKSELQVPELSSTSNQVCVDKKEIKKAKTRSVKKGKENLIVVNNS